MRNIIFVSSILFLLPLFAKAQTDFLSKIAGLSTEVTSTLLVIKEKQIADRGSEQLKNAFKYFTDNSMKIPKEEINRKYKRFYKQVFICEHIRSWVEVV